VRNAYNDFLSARFFAGLDGLRCLSIVAVVAYHVAASHGGLIGRGYLGVALFFAISGFLITTLLLRERDKVGQISLRGFFARRALRIFPLYYTVLGLYTAVVFLAEKDAVVRGDFFSNLPAFLSYTSNWFVPQHPDKRVIFYFAWSLATEEQFYLLWPLVIRLSKRAWVPVLFMCGLLAASLGTPALVSAGLVEGSQLGVRMLTSISASICMGCLAAYGVHSPRGFARVYPVLGQAWSVPVLAVVLLGVVAWHGAPAWLTSLAMVALVVATCIRSKQPLSAPMSHPWVRYIGTVSYGIYLLHMLVLNFVRRAVPGQGAAVQFVLTLALSVLVAGLSHRYFESWFLKLKGRFDWRGHAAPEAPRPAAPAETPAPLPGLAPGIVVPAEPQA
jgi:peptidoglycan/LPS O-acetylase OafA/YrhL